MGNVGGRVFEVDPPVQNVGGDQERRLRSDPADGIGNGKRGLIIRCRPDRCDDARQRRAEAQ
jgi:hypothetical protein